MCPNIAPPLPSDLPPGIAQELTRAVAREGWTDALRLAATRLPFILRMRPEDFEREFAGLYTILP